MADPVSLRITGFSGVVPRRGDRVLDANQAQVAVNCRLTSGYIAPLNEPKFVVNPGVAGIRAMFRMTDGVNDFRLTWNRDVDAIKGPIAGDATFRTYYTGDGEPRVTNIALATVGTPYPKTWFVLGVYPPQTAPSVTHGGGTGVAVTRSFVYTFVTPFGEESQPSPPSALVTGKVDGTWTIGAGPAMDVAPLNSMAITGASWAGGIATLTVASSFGLRVGEEINVSGMNPAGYNGSKLPITALAPTTVSYALAVNPGAFVAGGTLDRVAPHNTAGMTKRLYWTETLADGTHLRLVSEIPVATTNTTVAGNTISTAELASADWIMPPTDMKGIVLMANGIVAAFHGNEVLFSPAFIPYAFPIKYRQTTDYDIVGIGAVGTMLVVTTKGKPSVFSGIDPANMSETKINKPWPCLAKRSVVNLDQGVAYAAPVGLVLVGPGGAEIITHDLYTQEEWTALNPSTFYAAQYGGRYVASYGPDATRQVLIIDKSEFASEVQVNKDVTLFADDAGTGNLFLVIDDLIYQWDADAGRRMLADWLSREWVFPKNVNLGAAKIDAVFTMTEAQTLAAQAAFDAVKAANAAMISANATMASLNAASLNRYSLNGGALAPLPPFNFDSLTFQVYTDGMLRASHSLASARAFKIPGGYKADNASFRVSGNVTVKAIVVAETMQALAAA